MVVSALGDTRSVGRVVRLLDVVGLSKQVFIPPGSQKVFVFVCLVSVLVKRRINMKVCHFMKLT